MGFWVRWREWSSDDPFVSSLAAFYLPNHSAVLGLLPIKLKPWLVRAKNGRVVAMPPLESGSAPLCKCTLTGGNRQGWRSSCTRRNMPELHCENCGWWLMERALKPVRLHLNSALKCVSDGRHFIHDLEWNCSWVSPEHLQKNEVQWT